MSRQSGPSPVSNLVLDANYICWSRPVGAGPELTPDHRRGRGSRPDLGPLSRSAPHHGSLPGTVGQIWDVMEIYGCQWFVNDLAWDNPPNRLRLIDNQRPTVATRSPVPRTSCGNEKGPENRAFFRIGRARRVWLTAWGPTERASRASRPAGRRWRREKNSRCPAWKRHSKVAR